MIAAPSSMVSSKRRIAAFQKQLEKHGVDVDVVIDMEPEELMNERERKSLAMQVRTCYSRNVRSKRPMRLVATDVGPLMKARLKKLGADNWRMDYTEQRFVEMFDKSKVVYLSSEGTEELDTVVEGQVYVIGGLVDRNRHKGYTHERAQELGVRTARLPIGKFLESTKKTRKVLTVNHVYEILAAVVEGLSWAEAMESVLPERSGFKRKS